MRVHHHNRIPIMTGRSLRAKAKAILAHLPPLCRLQGTLGLPFQHRVRACASFRHWPRLSLPRPLGPLPAVGNSADGRRSTLTWTDLDP